MAKKTSTGALTKEQHAFQDKRYAEGHQYDYVIIGTGSAALTVGALLAHAGYTICMLEAHDTAGGYCHTFEQGDFSFCAQEHYIWGCGKGGKIYEFLKRIGLEKDITFHLMDPDGYDHMVMPDGKRVKIPYGWDKLIRNVVEAYPDQQKPMEKFINTMDTIRKGFRYLPGRPYTASRVLNTLKALPLVRYVKSTLQDAFDACGVSIPAQTVLAANAGDFGAPPNRLSLFTYAALFGGYNTGSYYPVKHYKYYISRLAEFITSHPGCHIYYETEVTRIATEGKKVTSVGTKDGKTFVGKNFICNADPQKMAHMIGWEKFPPREQKKLSYEYSPSGIMIYLGLKDVDLRAHGFGAFNIWHCEQFDMNNMWDEVGKTQMDAPWFFMSTPTLHTNEPGLTPGPNYSILEVATFIPYEVFKTAYDKNYAEYAKLKLRITNSLLDIIEQKYIPNLRKHIVSQTVGTPITNEDFVMAPFGNAYGSNMTPEQVSFGRLKQKTPFSNLYWCNASGGWAGMYGTVGTGMGLYMDLTGDRFYDGFKAPTDEEFIQAL